MLPVIVAGPITDQPRSAEFPPELWLEIIGYIQDSTTLAALMRVNHAFHDVAERYLYHTTTLNLDPVILRFCKSVSLSGRLANLVTCLHLPAIGSRVLGNNSRLFLPVLNSLRNLERLTPRLSDGVERSGVVSAKVLHDIVSLRFPLLRGFSTNLSVYVFPKGLAFLHNHPLLEDLDISFSPVSPVRTNAPAHSVQPEFGALRVMACAAWILRDRFAVPPTLTHYRARDLDLEPGELSRIARLLGPQLVSLRVSERFAHHYEHWPGRGPQAVALDELVRLFPRLRFLQLDMHLVSWSWDYSGPDVPLALSTYHYHSPPYPPRIIGGPALHQQAHCQLHR